MPMPTPGFPSSDWLVLENMITHMTDVLKSVSEMYSVKIKSEANLGAQVLAL